MKCINCGTQYEMRKPDRPTWMRRHKARLNPSTFFCSDRCRWYKSRVDSLSSMIQRCTASNGKIYSQRAHWANETLKKFHAGGSGW